MGVKRTGRTVLSCRSAEAAGSCGKCNHEKKDSDAATAFSGIHAGVLHDTGDIPQKEGVRLLEHKDRFGGTDEECQALVNLEFEEVPDRPVVHGYHVLADGNRCVLAAGCEQYAAFLECRGLDHAIGDD